MRDFTPKALVEGYRQSGIDTEEAMVSIDFCLDGLFKDREKNIVEEICYQLTFEELIGALLDARMKLIEIQTAEEVEAEFWDEEYERSEKHLPTEQAAANEFIQARFNLSQRKLTAHFELLEHKKNKFFQLLENTPYDKRFKTNNNLPVDGMERRQEVTLCQI